MAAGAWPERSPLESALLQDTAWGTVRVVDELGSTNATLVEQVRQGSVAARVLTTEHQVAGRGRLGRTWTAPARSSLAVSVVVDPPVEPSRWGWLPLVAGLAVRSTVVAAGLPSGRVLLKWPNDLLVDDAKVAGVLAGRVPWCSGRDGASVVLGIGLNVSLTVAELPTPSATSLAMAGAADLDRTRLLRALLVELDQQLRAWWADGDAAVRERYRGACGTLGREVRVLIPGRSPVVGLAAGIDGSGALVVDTAAGSVVVAAGDVEQVRPARSGAVEEPLTGGSSRTGVVRVGRTVRRPRGDSSAFVHAVLRRLEVAGVAGVPRLIGTDEDGREVLTHLPGPTGHGPDDWTAEQLAAVVLLVGSVHDALAGTAEAAGAETVCHGDVAPWNLVLTGDRPSGLIDFDEAAPGARADDIAYLGWVFHGLADRLVDPELAGSRLRELADGYADATGVRVHAELVGSLEREQLRILAQRRARARAAASPEVAADESARASGVAAQLDWTRRHAAELRRILGS